MAYITDDKSEICLERCYFNVNNCRQKGDGSWDCKKNRAIANVTAVTDERPE
jgi:hypothetical protein